MSQASKSKRGLLVRKNRLISTSSSSSEEILISRKRARQPFSGISEDTASSPKRQRVQNVASNLVDLLQSLNDSRNTPKTFINANQMLNALPEFDPENKAQNIEIWLHKVNEYAHIYKWDDRQTSHFATQKLTGTAKNWFHSLPSMDFSWADWQAKLRRAFPVEDNFALNLEEMFARKTKSDESLRIYFYDKLMLLNRCEITGKKAVDCIIHGITDRSLQNSAQALQCTEPEQLLKYLIVQQPTLHSFSTTQKKKGVPDMDDVKDNRFQRKQIRCFRCGKEGHASNRCFVKKEKYNRGAVNINANLKCYNCNEEGHRFVRCPKDLLRCDNCNKYVHKSDTCTNRNSSSMKTEFTNVKKVLNINSNPNDKFHKIVKINKNDMRSYIDFGADCSLIQHKIAIQLNLPKIYTDLPVIKGFGNDYVTPLFKSQASVKIDEVQSLIDIYVVDDQLLNNPLLIGQNFTEAPHVCVLKDDKSLNFYYQPQVVTSDVTCVRLITSEAIDLNESKLVSVHTEPKYSGDIYVEGKVQTIPTKEIYIHQGVYKIVDGIGHIFVSNSTKKSITLECNKVLARAAPFTESSIFKVREINKVTSEIMIPLSKGDIQVGCDVNPVMFDKLYELLNNYRDCFALSLQEIGCVDQEFEMDIQLTDSKPIVYRPYRLSHTERAKVREMVTELTDTGIIRDSTSDYASPILMVKKKTGEQRLCVDFRALNAKTVKDRYPLPLIDDQIANLSGNRYFTTLDMSSGYYQIPVSEKSKHLTAFVTPDGHYEFNRMPFGLANAPAVFQKIVNKVLGPRRFDSVLAYMDDLLIPTQSIKEGLEKLEEVLKLLREYGLTLKLSKCNFFTSSIDYLGYDVSADGIKPSERKTLAIKNFPMPTNVHEVRQFLGLASYFRKFVKGFGEIAQPLTKLLKKDESWQWTDVESQAVFKLKETLCQRPILALYNPKLDTELHTDASSIGIGGILMQWQENPRVLKPVAYFSRQTSPEEKHYHSYELETLAVVGSLKKFRPYVLGTHFKIFTDCKALRLTRSKKDILPRIARWILQMEEYDFEIEHRAGDRMAHVDALSRNPVEAWNDDCYPDNVMTVFRIQQNDWFLTMQLGDPEISRIAKLLKPDIDDEFEDIKKHYVFKNNTLFRKINGDRNELRIVIPKGARWQVCRMNHDEIGHFGVKKTTEKIQSQYWFPKMGRFIKKYVQACLNCAYNKDDDRQKKGYIYPIEKSNRPFQTIHIDHLGPFIKSKRGNTHILTIVDGFSKYVFVKPVRDTKSATAIRVLENVFQDFQNPERIISDRGSAFTSEQFKQFCRKNNIKHVLNAVACPRANGQVERFNQTVLKAIATQSMEQKENEWDLIVANVQSGINNTVNATTGKTAAEVMFGFKLNGTTNYVFNEITNEVEQEAGNLQDIRDDVSKTIKMKQNKMKIDHDSKALPARVYNKNDLVKLTKVSFNENPGQSKKLLPKFIGPYKITKVLGNDRYKIASVPGLSTNRKYSSVVSADRIRPWINIRALNVESDQESTDSSSS